MASVDLLDVLILIILIAIVIALGTRGYAISKSMVGYFLAGRGLGAWVLSFSFMAAYYSAASFIGGGGATYLFNLGFGAWLIAWHVVGVVLAWVLVAGRLFSYASKTGVLSIPDFIEHRYQSRIAKAIAAIAIIFLFTLYLTAVYKGGAIIIATMLNTSYEVGLLILVIPVLIYIGLGGLKAAALNNLLMGVMMLIAAAITFGYVMTAVGGWHAGLAALEKMVVVGEFPGTMWMKFDGMGPPPVMAVGLVPSLIMSVTFSISMAQLALPHLLMQFYAARDVRVINYGRIIGPLAVSIYAILLFSLGAFCHVILDPKLTPPEIGALLKDVDWVIPRTLMMIGHSGVRGFVFAAIIAASMSTLAVSFLVLSAALTRDIIYTFRPKVDERKLLTIAKTSPVAFALISLLLAAYIAMWPIPIIVDIVGAAFGIIFACFVGPVTIGLYWKGATKAGAIASILAGLIVGLIWHPFYYRVYWIHSVIPALLTAIPLFFIVSLVTKKPSKEVLDLLGKP